MKIRGALQWVDANSLPMANLISHFVTTQELAHNLIHNVCMNEPLDTDGILRRMRQAYAVKNDSELGVTLGLSASAISNWRQRNSPPFALCADIACKKDISLDWLIFGVGSMQMGVPADMQKNEKRVPDAQVQRMSEFIAWWSTHRSHDELIWLEQQIWRAVPEYGKWLAGFSQREA